MRRPATSPAVYRNSVEEPLREILEQVRSVVLELVPEASEGIEHGMLDYPGLANLAAQKGYVAVYVAPAVLEKHKKNFPGVSAGKSCLRLRRLEQAQPEALRALLFEVLAYRQA